MTLPNFIIGGINRGGTTSLSFYLRQHPQVYFSPNKEPRYFLLPADNDTSILSGKRRENVLNMADYLALFAGVTSEKAIGEGSPFYLTSAVARRRIRATIPDVRMIFSLRDPVARAYSAYWFHYRQLDPQLTVADMFSDKEHPAIRTGRYLDYLAPWYDSYAPTQLKVVTIDDLQQDALGVYRDLCRFLEIDDTFVPDLTVRNRGGVAKNAFLGRMLRKTGSRSDRLATAVKPKLPAGALSTLNRVLTRTRDRNLQKFPPLDPVLGRKLGTYYRDDIERLEALLGRDLSAWKR